jgi:hypothetical protein
LGNPKKRERDVQELTNMAESYKEGYSSRKAVLPVMMLEL